MKCSGTGDISSDEFFLPKSLFNVIGVKIVKSCLFCVHTSKNVHFWVNHYGRMSVSAKRFFSFLLFDVIPNVSFKRVLVNIVHGKMTVPAAKRVKRVIVDDWSMSETIWGQVALTDNFGPEMLFHVVRIKVGVSEVPIEAAKNKELLFIKVCCVINSWGRDITFHGKFDPACFWKVVLK